MPASRTQKKIATLLGALALLGGFATVTISENTVKLCNAALECRRIPLGTYETMRKELDAKVAADIPLTPDEWTAYVAILNIEIRKIGGLTVTGKNPDGSLDIKKALHEIMAGER